MTRLTSVKLILAASGLVIWGIGINRGPEPLKWIGIALLVAAVLLRFVGRKKSEE
jgi:hypothetical protein